MIALFARTLLTAKLIVLAVGVGPSAGYSRRSPASVSSTTVTLMAMATAAAGIPQSPPAGKARVELAPRAGPPETPAGFRVSATRQGARGKKPLAVGRKAFLTAVSKG